MVIVFGSLGYVVDGKYNSYKTKHYPGDKASTLYMSNARTNIALLAVR